MQVEFSDESDPEADPKAELRAKREVSKKRTTATRTARNPKTALEPPAEKAPAKSQARLKRSTPLPQSTISSEEEGAAVAQPAPARRGRARRPLAGTEAGTGGEPEKMRTIKEEMDGILDLSIEQLRASDTEAEENVASSKERRLMCLVS